MHKFCLNKNMPNFNHFHSNCNPKTTLNKLPWCYLGQNCIINIWCQFNIIMKQIHARTAPSNGAILE